MRRWLTGMILAGVIGCAGCGPTVTVQHKVDPIYIKVDVNIKVQKELEQFFAFEDEVKVQETSTKEKGGGDS